MYTHMHVNGSYNIVHGAVLLLHVWRHPSSPLSLSSFRTILPCFHNSTDAVFSFVCSVACECVCVPPYVRTRPLYTVVLL